MRDVAQLAGEYGAVPEDMAVPYFSGGWVVREEALWEVQVFE